MADGIRDNHKKFLLGFAHSYSSWFFILYSRPVSDRTLELQETPLASMIYNNYDLSYIHYFFL